MTERSASTLNRRARRRPARGADAPPLRALYICGGTHQTRQMHAVADALPEFEAYFTPYYADGFVDLLRRLRRIEFTILGEKRRQECLRYLHRHRLRLDMEGRARRYDLVVTCSDLVVPRNVHGAPLVLVQEGMTDPKRFWYYARQLIPALPRWCAGSAYNGTSNLYDRFCVASEGYREHFIARGADPSRIVVTGVPVLDDCARYLDNAFPHRRYVLVCTSDARETLRPDNRRGFIKNAVRIANGRPLFFKLHPNENRARATREIQRWAPGARVFIDGSAEEMVANCDVLVCQYSTLVYVGLALGKEVHSYFDPEEMKRLLPIQGGHAARDIAEVCRRLVHERRAQAQGPGQAPARASTPARRETGSGGQP